MRLIRLFKRDLAADAQTWIADGIVSRSQAESILATYGTELAGRSWWKTAFYVLLLLGALFTGLGLILLISHNWQEIPRAVRLVSLVAVTMTFHTFGIYHYRRGQRSATSTLLFLLGSLCYGASIFLIGQMYHLGERFFDGIFLWALGILPLAALTKSRVLTFLVAAVSGLWLAVEAYNGFFPGAYILFVLFQVWIVWRKRSIILFMATVMGAIFYLETALAYWMLDPSSIIRVDVVHFYFTAGLFILLYGGAKLLASTRQNPILLDYCLALRLWIVRFAVVALVALSFSGSWFVLIAGAARFALFITICTLTVAGGVAAMALVSWRQTPRPSFATMVDRHGSTIAFASLLWVSTQVGFFGLGASFADSAEMAQVLQVVTNLVILASGLG